MAKFSDLPIDDSDVAFNEYLITLPIHAYSMDIPQGITINFGEGRGFITFTKLKRVTDINLETFSIACEQ